MGNEMSDVVKRLEAESTPPSCEVLNKVSEGKIKWFAFSTTNCNYCREPSAFESGFGALCHEHAIQYIGGKVTIPKAPLANEDENHQVAIQIESRSAGLYDVYSQDGRHERVIEINEHTTVGDLKAMLEGDPR